MVLYFLTMKRKIFTTCIMLQASRYTYKCSKSFTRCLSSSNSFKILDGHIDKNSDTFSQAAAKSEEVKEVLRYLMSMVHAGGGERGIHRHTVINKKMLPRQRLKLLFDDDSPILEIAPLAGLAMEYGNIPSAGSIVQIGQIHGHYCIVSANDATVKGGAIFPIGVTKQLRAQQLSFLNRLPSIYLVDSGGAFLPLQADIFPDKNHGGQMFNNEAILSSAGIPQIALVCGSCTAGGAYVPTMAEEAIIVKKIGTIFLGGPPLVKAAIGEVVTEEQLGGADLHCYTSGCTDYYAETEEEGLSLCRESVLALNLEKQRKQIDINEPLYSAQDLAALGGLEKITKGDVYKIFSRILDGSMFKEFKSKFGCNLITGFGFIHGQMVGILANCGVITSADALKGAHFLQLGQKRNIPLIFLQNCGNCEADSQIRENSLKDRAKMIAAHSCTNVPKITINIGGCYGDDNFTMCGASFNPNFIFSWPLACTSLYEKPRHFHIAKNNEVNIHQIMKLFMDPTGALYRSANIHQDGIILPEDTRKVLAMCLDISLSRFQFKSSSESRLPILRM